MGFFDSFLKGLNDDKENRMIVDMVNDLDEDNPQYRNKTLANAPSNYGWYTCARCGKKFRRSQVDVDYIIPRSKGGDNSRYNLQILCQHCNRSKQNDMKDTADDLERRNRELKRQDREDRELLNYISRKRR